MDRFTNRWKWNIESFAEPSVSSLNTISDVLTEDKSLYIADDPSGNTSTAQYNVAVGVTALDAIITGDNNTAIGYNSLTANTTGESNTAIGYESLRDNETGGNFNTAIGRHALKESISGNENVAIGRGTTELGDQAINNIAIGSNGIVSDLITGSNNIFIGYAQPHSDNN